MFLFGSSQVAGADEGRQYGSGHCRLVGARVASRMMKYLLLLSLLAVAGCLAGPSASPLTVREVIDEAQSLDGREIIVEGWLDQCQRLSCPLFASSEDTRSDDPYFLSIGSAPWFDIEMRVATPTWIVLRARFHDLCVNDPASGNYAVCSDRPETLEPLALIR